MEVPRSMLDAYWRPRDSWNCSDPLQMQPGPRSLLVHPHVHHLSPCLSAVFSLVPSTFHDRKSKSLPDFFPSSRFSPWFRLKIDSSPPNFPFPANLLFSSDLSPRSTIERFRESVIRSNFTSSSRLIFENWFFSNFRSFSIQKWIFRQIFRLFLSSTTNIWIVQLKIDSSSNFRSSRFFWHKNRFFVQYFDYFYLPRLIFESSCNWKSILHRIFDLPDSHLRNSQKSILRPIFQLFLPSMINIWIVVQFKIDSLSNFQSSRSFSIQFTQKSILCSIFQLFLLSTD